LCRIGCTGLETRSEKHIRFTLGLLIAGAAHGTAAFAGGGDSVWEKLRNPQSSPEVNTNQCFVGCWQLAMICLYGPGIEFILDPLTLMVSNQIKIQATMLADVAFRFAGAFGITAAVT
jgi:hypothetical protein